MKSKTKIAYAVFTYSEITLKETMVKGNFGANKTAANKWKKGNEHTYNSAIDKMQYPRGLFVKQIKY